MRAASVAAISEPPTSAFLSVYRHGQPPAGPRPDLDGVSAFRTARDPTGEGALCTPGPPCSHGRRSVTFLRDASLRQALASDDPASSVLWATQYEGGPRGRCDTRRGHCQQLLSMGHAVRTRSIKSPRGCP